MTMSPFTFPNLKPKFIQEPGFDTAVEIGNQNRQEIRANLSLKHQHYKGLPSCQSKQN